MARVLGAWLVPIAVCPPLFSRDVYAYVAQGDLVAQGVSPYRVGPAALADPRVVSLVDPMWRHAAAPYGPLFVSMSETIVTLAHHDVLAALVLWRVLAVVSLAVVAGATVVIARGTGRDPVRALALVALNPLVVLVLVGGMHNDGIMLAFLAGGVACAYRDRPVLGVVLCAMGATVKLPALVGVLAIGWVWVDRGAPRAARLRRLGTSVGIGVATVALTGLLAQLGWGWLWDVSGPGAVVSWLDPATALGLVANHLGSALGLGAHQAGSVRAARALALVVTLLAALVVVGRSDRRRRGGRSGLEPVGGRPAGSDGVALVRGMVRAVSGRVGPAGAGRGGADVRLGVRRRCPAGVVTVGRRVGGDGARRGARRGGGGRRLVPVRPGGWCRRRRRAAAAGTRRRPRSAMTPSSHAPVHTRRLPLRSCTQPGVDHQ